ncbi:MAG: hypothetical protein WCI40_02230 [Verrucomicrobiota bacterium]
MKRLTLLAVLLCGCMHTHKDCLSTVRVQAALESAAHSTQNATQRTATAQVSLRLATAKSRELLTVASPSERPLLVQLEAALEQTQTELDGAQQQLKSADGALEDSSWQLEALQNQLRAMDAELGKAREAANRLQAGRDFWRASAWKLALLALALGVWTFRKPLIALCGGPVL